MRKDLKIVVIEGSKREKRKSMNVAKYIANYGNNIDGVETVLVDPSELNLPSDGGSEEVKDPVYSKLTLEADGFFIITPEYNHSFSGTLKRVLDSEYSNYFHKPVALAGVSSGNWGGVRAIESLVPSLRKMGLIVTSSDVYFPYINDQFDDNGNLLNEDYNSKVERSYKELIWLSKILKEGRENHEN